MPDGGGLRLSALSLALFVISLTMASTATAESLYVVRRGWHVDVGFEASQLMAPLAGVAAEYPQLNFLLIGFGDKRYVLARHHGSGTLAAALWPGQGMMLVTGLGATPAQAFGADNVILLEVTADQMRAAQGYVWSSFKSRANQAARFADGPYEGSLFFESTARYSALYTCNTWVADVLRSGGVRVGRNATVLASQLWRQVRADAVRRQSSATIVPAPDAPEPSS